MVMNQFMNISQGTMNWNAFIRDLEIKAKPFNLDKKPYTIDDAIKHAAKIWYEGCPNEGEGSGRGPIIETLSRWCQAKESGMEDAHQIKKDNHIKKVQTRTSTSKS